MDLSQLPGLGPKRLEALHKTGIFTVSDLLYNIPRTYLDQTKVSKIANCKVGEKVVLIGTVRRAGIVRGRTSRFIASFSDGTGEISLLFFKACHFWSKKIKPDSHWLVTGTVGEYRGLQITHPDMQPFDEGEEFNGRILPVYPISEACREARMEQKFFRQLYATVFKFPGLTLPGVCPRELTDYLHFAPVLDNLRVLHNPVDFAAIRKAKGELKILELMPFCLRMIRRRQNQMVRGHERQVDLGRVMQARAALPFQLTDGQENALNEIVAGLNGKSSSMRCCKEMSAAARPSSPCSQCLPCAARANSAP